MSEDEEIEEEENVQEQLGHYFEMSMQNTLTQYNYNIHTASSNTKYVYELEGFPLEIWNLQSCKLEKH